MADEKIHAGKDMRQCTARLADSTGGRAGWQGGGEEAWGSAAEEGEAEVAASEATSLVLGLEGAAPAQSQEAAAAAYARCCAALPAYVLRRMAPPPHRLHLLQAAAPALTDPKSPTHWCVHVDHSTLNQQARQLLQLCRAAEALCADALKVCQHLL